MSEYDANSSAAPAAAPAPAKAAAPSASSDAKPSSAAAVVPVKANLFAELSKEGEVTKGLKTVTKDMQTWRKEYSGGAAAPAPAAAPKRASAATADVVKGTPKLEYQPGGAKWVVEFQTGAAGQLDVTIGDKKETVYVFGCVGANVNIIGKCKSIVIDGCKKTQLHFDAAFASVEVVNSQRIQVGSDTPVNKER